MQLVDLICIVSLRLTSQTVQMCCLKITIITPHTDKVQNDVISDGSNFFFIGVSRLLLLDYWWAGSSNRMPIYKTLTPYKTDDCLPYIWRVEFLLNTSYHFDWGWRESQTQIGGDRLAKFPSEQTSCILCTSAWLYPSSAPIAMALEPHRAYRGEAISRDHWKTWN